MKKTLSIKKCLAVLILMMSLQVSAQTKDDKALFQKFALICNSYKQLPLQLTVESSKKTNLVITAEDTAVTGGSFFIDKNNAYIRFGNVEQLITDSFALIVMSDIKQMVYSSESVDISARLSSMMNTAVSNQTVSKLSELYIISTQENDKGTGVLKLETRKKIPGSEFPAEELSLTYNSKNEPVVIESLTRRLIRKPESGEIPAGVTVINLRDRGDYLLKEDKTAYMYRKIEHVENLKIPVLLSDRIVRDGANNYTPVKKYEQYELKFN